MSTAIYKTVLAMLKIIGIGSFFTLAIIIVHLENENQILTKLNDAKDSVNDGNKGELRKLKGSFQYQWISKYNNDSLKNIP